MPEISTSSYSRDEIGAINVTRSNFYEDRQTKKDSREYNLRERIDDKPAPKEMLYNRHISFSFSFMYFSYSHVLQINYNP